MIEKRTPKTILGDAWTAYQEGDFYILQAITDLDNEEIDFDPEESLKEAITRCNKVIQLINEVRSLRKTT